MNGSPNIEMAGLEVAHEEQSDGAVLHEVAWEIHPGERWVVCGGPGSGKSSLFCTGAGLTPPVAGSFRTFGREFWRAGEAGRLALSRRIGIVFEGGGRLFAHMSVLDNLILPLQYHGDYDADTARQRALELLAQVGLESFADVAPARLTMAKQRRVAFVRTLTKPVDVLFLDGPMIGIGPREAHWWRQQLGELAAQRNAAGGPMSIVVSGYEFSPWFGWANRFATLGEGAFRAVGESEARAYAGDAVEPAADPASGPITSPGA